MSDEESEGKGQVWTHLSHRCQNKGLCLVGREQGQEGGKSSQGGVPVSALGKGAQLAPQFPARPKQTRAPPRTAGTKCFVVLGPLSHESHVLSVLGPAGATAGGGDTGDRDTGDRAGAEQGRAGRAETEQERAGRAWLPSTAALALGSPSHVTCVICVICVTRVTPMEQLLSWATSESTAGTSGLAEPPVTRGGTPGMAEPPVTWEGPQGWQSHP